MLFSPPTLVSRSLRSVILALHFRSLHHMKDSEEVNVVLRSINADYQPPSPSIQTHARSPAHTHTHRSRKHQRCTGTHTHTSHPEILHYRPASFHRQTKHLPYPTSRKVAGIGGIGRCTGLHSASLSSLPRPLSRQQCHSSPEEEGKETEAPFCVAPSIFLLVRFTYLITPTSTHTRTVVRRPTTHFFHTPS